MPYLQNTTSDEILLLNKWIIKKLRPKGVLLEHTVAALVWTIVGIPSKDVLHTILAKWMTTLVDKHDQCSIGILVGLA
jgi:hypothetical protein